jgi:uncharacterized protein YndB with AHSA1/START domain
MLTYILIGVAVLVAILVIVVSMRPGEFRIERSGIINAPPSKVFPHVNDFHLWQEWSPWAKRDPNCIVEYDGPDTGEGAKFHWNGNKEVGEGRMTIIESTPDKIVAIRLEFIRPMKAINTAEFAFKPVANGTEVTWVMTGKNNFIGKAFHLMIDCDKMIGKDFEQGLANLRAQVEGSSEPSLVAH